MRSSDKDDGPPSDAVAVLDAVIEHVAEEEAENGESTEQDVRWSRDVRREMQSRISALRRQLTPVEPIDQPAASIVDDIRALDRAGLLARLEALGQGAGTHQELAGLSDEDLRRMLARLTGPTEGETP